MEQKIKKDQRKFLIIVLLIAFGFAGDRLFRFYYQHMPVAKEGQCITVKLPGRALYSKAQVLSNDFEEGTCTLIVETPNTHGVPSTFDVATDIPYQDLRDLDVQRISCEKTN